MTNLFDLLSENSKNDDVLSSLKKISGKKKYGNNAKSPSVEQRPFRFQIPESMVFDFVALDVETTGLDSKTDRVIEVGAVRFSNGQPVAEYATLINPQQVLNPYITQLTGIAGEDLTDSPLFKDIASTLMDFIGELPLCGHQIDFDINFLNEEFKRCGMAKLTVPDLDTALLSRMIVPEVMRFNLKHVTRSLGIDLHQAHRALADAKASGFLACELIKRLSSVQAPTRSVMARFAAGSLVKSLLFQSLGRSGQTVANIIGIHEKEPKKLSPAETPATLDIDSVRDIFSPHGSLSAILGTYDERPSQTRMAQCVADAYNTSSYLVAEAGTGTGKSLAYLIPSALFALKNNARILISTHTRNLQDQLTHKDLPVVQQVVGDNLRYSILKGRTNYLCIRRYHRLLSGNLIDLSYRERMGMLPLIRWAQETKTGDIEEQNQFNIKWYSRIWRMICADAHLCDGKRCKEYSSCFLQHARQRALGSHIVVINHALFFSEICSESSFLGGAGSVVFDEAHHLESSGHKHLRVEVDTNRFMQFLDGLTHFDKDIKSKTSELQSPEIVAKEYKALCKRTRSAVTDFLDDVQSWLSTQNRTTDEFHLPYDHTAFCRQGSFAALLSAFSDVQDFLYMLDQSLDTKDNDDPASLRPQLRLLRDRTSQLKADLDYAAGAQTEDHVFWIEGNFRKGWIKLCGVPLNIGTILSELWQKNNNACIFTSATLSIAHSMDYFKHKVGLDGSNETKTRCEFFESPFLPMQSLRASVAGGPDADAPDYPAYIAKVIERLMVAEGKNILVLFTANAMLEAVYTHCKSSAGLAQSVVLAQGISGNRQVVLEDFKASQNAVLLGADSFWEGIDVPGQACEIVIIPRLPFQVPTHPLTQALASSVEKECGESFFSFTVPEAIIKFRQGTGRLIRSAQDRGVLLVLDHRIVSKNYGKRFRASLDGNMETFASVDAMLESVHTFFSHDDTADSGSTIHYVPFEDLE